MKIAIAVPSKFHLRPNYRRRIGLLSTLESINITYNPSFFDSYDLIVLNENSDLTHWLDYRKSPILFDSINAYSLDRSFSIVNSLRGLYKYISGIHSCPVFSYSRLLTSLYARSSHVTSVSSLQRDYISRFSSCSIILDCFSEFGDCSKTNYSIVKPNTLSIFWEGQSANLTSLFILNTLLSHAILPFNIHINIVTDEFMPSKFFQPQPSFLFLSKYLHPSISFSILPWSIDNIHKSVVLSDIGFIPLQSDILFQAKPANKAILMSYLGLPVCLGSNPSYQAFADRFDHVQTFRTINELLSNLIELYTYKSLRKMIVRDTTPFSRSVSSSEYLSSRWLKALSFASS